MAYIAANAVSFAESQSTRYKSGECWILVEDALILNGGKSSIGQTPNFSKNSAYIWGRSINIAALQAGDVLQFSHYSWVRTTEVEFTKLDKGGSIDSKDVEVVRGEPQHSALVVKVISAGIVKVIEQNIPAGKGWVQTVDMVLVAPPVSREEKRDKRADGDYITVTTVTDVVKNPPKCYRPVDA